MKTNKTSIFNRGGSLLAALTAYHVVVAIFVLTLVTGAGSLIGSNMGFKATRDFDQNADPTAANAYGVALPHNNPWIGQGVSKGWASDANYFLNDLCNGSGGPYPYLTLTKYDNSLPGFVTQGLGSTCSTFAGTPFDFVEGESYSLGLGGTTIAGVVLVGSQDPTFPPGGTQFTYNADPTARNAFGVSVTPNTKWTDANQLLTEWCDGDGSDGGPYPYLTLTKYDNTLPGYVTQGLGSTCSTFAGTNFPLVPFEGYELGLGGATVTRTQEPYY